LLSVLKTGAKVQKIFEFAKKISKKGRKNIFAEGLFLFSDGGIFSSSPMENNFSLGEFYVQGP